MFGSLDFVCVPTVDVDATARAYVEGLGAELRRKVRGSGHLSGPTPILVYRVDSYTETVAALREGGIDIDELEIPHGPCASFTAASASATPSTG